MKQKRYFQTTSYGRARHRKRSLLIGLLIGMVIGVAAVVGIAIYLNYAATPFTNMNQLIDHQGDMIASDDRPIKTNPDDQMAALDAKIKELTDSRVGKAALRVEKSASEEVAAKEFDFYKILPGKSDIASVKSAQPTSKKMVASAAAHQHYLQVGSFQNASDANNLKAKLALMGIHAKIQSISAADKGLIHRVRVGPINKASIEPLRALLAQNGIQAVMATQ